ncbi:hypothetical protein AB1N83_009431 [Pleurotus pulmonarius]
MDGRINDAIHDPLGVYAAGLRVGLYSSFSHERGIVEVVTQRGIQHCFGPLPCRRPCHVMSRALGNPIFTLAFRQIGWQVGTLARIIRVHATYSEHHLLRDIHRVVALLVRLRILLFASIVSARISISSHVIAPSVSKNLRISKRRLFACVSDEPQFARASSSKLAPPVSWSTQDHIRFLAYSSFRCDFRHEHVPIFPTFIAWKRADFRPHAHAPPSFRFAVR